MIDTVHESLSSILGWMSIACWIVVYSPQILENYQLQSGEGLSVFFVIIWLIGDLTNLFGALLAGLLPTIIILAAYYSTCDLILLWQIYYYRWKASKRSVSPLVSDVSVPPGPASENTPLLPTENVTDNAHKRPSLLSQFIRYSAAVLFVLMTGVAAWAVDQHIHRGEPRTQPEEVVEWRSQLLGWISAVMFLGARVPQILRNLETKCEGLSPALFMFSIAGNTTYSLSILAASMDYHHLFANASWLAAD
ncbi:hypothetical protein EIP91_002934 [Steccherinum ochraceum]|uniref:PQ-loop-domain-containing protein n=1 Tax=Steccherinum ochraceum TaxID=92696 RepID=A0A4R0RJT5_9APHY|nr:hypothetical protein EIP91_002934 [Steccherinum ochraceum]